MDSILDALFNGGRFRVLAVVNDCSRICHGLLAGKSPKCIDVLEKASDWNQVKIEIHRMAQQG